MNSLSQWLVLLVSCSRLFFARYAAAGAEPFFFQGFIALTDQQLAYIRHGGAPAIMTAARKANPALLLLLMN
jgi:hypothetical protein